MTLRFPNPSRSYDPERRRIRFWAHDSAMEIPLFVKESALLRLAPDTTTDELAMLATFDANRAHIHDVANKIHSYSRQSFHILDATDF